MQLTPNYRLRKPDGTDPVDVQDLNDNMDVLDTEVAEKLDKTGDASNVVNKFTQAGGRANLTSGEKLSLSLGKIAKWFADLKTVAFSGKYSDLTEKPSIPSGSAASCAVANNDTTTAAGFVADARIVKQHGDEIDKVNQDLAKGQIQFDIQNGKGFYKAVGADTWTPFKTGVTLLGRYSAVSTYDLSNVPGYESLNVDDFLCVTNTGNTNGSKYENDSNGTIQLSIGYTAAQLSYNASTGILTITPALLSGSAFHNPATATASGYLSTSVYLIQ